MIGLVLLDEIVFVGGAWTFSGETTQVMLTKTPEIAAVHNTEAIGNLMYTRYVYLFQAAGLVLLVAMIGAIVLTHRQRDGVRKQRIGAQIAVRREDVVEVVKVTKGGGV